MILCTVAIRKDSVCGRPQACKHFFRQVWHVVRCGRVSGLVMRLVIRRRPVWRCVDQVHIDNAGLMPICKGLHLT